MRLMTDLDSPFEIGFDQIHNEHQVDQEHPPLYPSFAVCR